jgi:hypothetical protein
LAKGIVTVVQADSLKLSRWISDATSFLKIYGNSFIL